MVIIHYNIKGSLPGCLQTASSKFKYLNQPVNMPKPQAELKRRGST